MEQLKFYLFRRNDRVHRIKQNSRIDVSYFQQRRWQLLTLLEQLSGFGPHQSKLQQCPLRLLHMFFLLTIFLATANKSREYVGFDADMTIECCMFMLLYFAMVSKLLFTSIYHSSRQKIYKIIAGHFEAMSNPEEAAALNESAESGFKYALGYIYGMCLCAVIFVGIPVLLALYQYIFDHRELNMQIPLPMNFGFDHSKYWYVIAVHLITFLCSFAIADFAYDLSFMMQIRHVSALFKIVRIRLGKASKLVDESKNENLNDVAADQSYSIVSSAINLHGNCLDLVKQIEDCYAMNWFLVLLISTGGLGAGLYIVSTKLHDPIETIRYTAAFTIIVSHFQMTFSQGQMIIDSSSTILDACYECKWYSMPKKSRKLLLMMMVRTSIPCQLTGAQLFPLSMETFSKLLKAGLSYYTVFKARTT